jgi:hypothetical protein
MPDGPYFTRRALLVGCAAALTRVLPAHALLEVRNRDEQIFVTAPDFHFLTGRTLDRLHDGHTIGFEFQLALATQPKGPPLRKSLERFLISYDLWEEKFSVTRVHRDSRPKTDLTAGAAEAWCLDHVMVPTSEIPREAPLWVRLDVRAEDASGIAKSDGEGGFDLTGLIEIFSRPGRDKQTRWSLETGPVQLGSLGREESRR